ncbi:hypothetical protein CHS0354_019762 [Potamilus streckersoni]|uniref:Uncharacterized protein n=1 Tax=Potamilus streckersoni TaxID=2493646 RepID=A0AAE0SA77_9BIVA|nr:hypothetical protein CHS0354_019762 [Potamilus streckersoni]
MLFTGFIVSLLFCFLNGEVQAEIKKKWHRFKLRRSGNFSTRRGTRDTMVSFASIKRDSVASTNGKDYINGNGRIFSEDRSLTQIDNNIDSNIVSRANGHSQISLENIDEKTEEIGMLENLDTLCDGTNILDEDLV